ncbi:ATP-binding protein [Bacillus sp. HNG]|uniref:AAA family ATPase n=1 Tax=Bacillus sp. HNG TaxID=2293325 RepID=UPI000E2EB467|nr:ATP-binding protein [Bacillus sp. HNG]RFB14963.1 ATP-binding protein [Bacillus sp. HNG]
MSLKRKFPVELLNATNEEKVEYFKNYTVAHPYFKEAYEKILKHIKNPSTKTVILIYGPSGSGKSELFKKVYENIYKDFRSDMERNRGFIPICGFEAIAPSNSKYDWKDHFIRSLIAIKEPLIDHKIDINKLKNKDIEFSDREVDRSLRRSLENALKYRKTLAFMIDEAQHMTYNGSAKTSNNQMNLIKSLASISKTPHFLFGTYEILEFRNANGQLCKRGIDVHLKRYDVRNKEERKWFIQTLMLLQKHLPLEIEPELSKNWKTFYRLSVGCIGLLKDLLLTTLEFKLLEQPNLKTLLLEDFEEFALTNTQLYQLAQEAMTGEDTAKAIGRSQEEVSNKLGIPGEVNHKQVTEEHSEENDGKKPEKKTGKVGERNPTRDEVG